MIETECSLLPIWKDGTNWDDLVEKAIDAAISVSTVPGLSQSAPPVIVSIAFSDNAHVQLLNRDYRGKDKPTNILSFPMMASEEIEDWVKNGLGADGPPAMLGDMILAHQVCAEEARTKDITLSCHVSHLIAHGTLHLLGFDHIDDKEAEYMENLEVKALASLGISNPYSDSEN